MFSLEDCARNFNPEQFPLPAMEKTHDGLEVQPTPHPFIGSTAFASTLQDYNLSVIDNHSTNNSVEIDPYYFFTEAQFAVMSIIFLAIIVGNVSVIVALLFTNARKSRMNFFIMQLAIADLLVGLLYVLPDIIQKVLITWYGGEFLCKMSKFLSGVMMFASSYVLVALSIDRCDAIISPMNFSGSRNRARALVVAAYIISILCSVPLLILPKVTDIKGRAQCWIELDDDAWKIWITTVAVMIMVLPSLTIAACYTVIVLTIWNKSKGVILSPPVTNSKKTKAYKNGNPDGDPDSRRASSRGLIPRAKIKSVKMSLVIVIVFILCWSVYFVFDIMQVYQLIPSTQYNIAMATLVQSFAPLNSAANPLICCLFSPHIYVGLRRIPPYSWFWRFRSRGARGTLRSRSDSTVHSDLLSSSNVRRTNTQSAASMLNSARRGSGPARAGEPRHARLQLSMATPRE